MRTAAARLAGVVRRLGVEAFFAAVPRLATVTGRAGVAFVAVLRAVVVLAAVVFFAVVFFAVLVVAAVARLAVLFFAGAAVAVALLRAVVRAALVAFFAGPTPAGVEVLRAAVRFVGAVLAAAVVFLAVRLAGAALVLFVPVPPAVDFFAVARVAAAFFVVCVAMTSLCTANHTGVADSRRKAPGAHGVRRLLHPRPVTVPCG